ncbi:UDP-GlcNAc:undecaprenyl-phosphate GlcNAc-1-phosphate transferase [Pseudonocardia thermophila]|jgi:UDP-N-acetylmuramyl pentapeptide phosphotransferase/UDP-N-acetylglucosamine-1-phosphate transferase|uniref:UDP-GlcNAc:undecaprenyl-phosphate GlcNAc-1-phosphate transferase n=1 Tax=Pseudonocardia thermophila TaxID=1848 RepID=A0A1M6QD40_PSETH|nr:MraY family glycosyltransferase [Pseudonocardia thermophila]SHK18096.1 UDP-GlcNAc:undecaprenyl-phosphate GlcNAc-1-phosphate transferase [Pseudonocardia thermophila]
MGIPFKEYLLAGSTAAVITYLLVGAVRLLALKAGAVAWPRGRDVHTTPTPRWGGIAMLGGVLAGVAIAYQLPALRLAFDTNTQEVLGAVLAAIVLCAVGIIDDRYELDALTKFAGQLTATGALLFFGVQWTVVWVPWGGPDGQYLSLGQEQGALLTVLLTVALVNAMNFIDGLDGLAAGVGAIAATATGLYALSLVAVAGNDPSVYSPALIAALLAGACLGFLPHNFSPARIFMGDSGSMLIGVMLAAATTIASGKQSPAATGSSVNLLALFSPLIVLAAVVFVPVLDLLLAVVRRTRKGLSPFAPDKMHLHHRLLEIGHSQRRAVLLIYLWAGLLAFGSVALTVIGDPVLVLVTLGIGIVFAVLATAIPRLRRLNPRAAEPATLPVTAPATVPDDPPTGPTLPLPSGGPRTSG